MKEFSLLKAVDATHRSKFITGKGDNRQEAEKLLVLLKRNKHIKSTCILIKSKSWHINNDKSLEKFGHFSTCVKKKCSKLFLQIYGWNA
jgi:hypothetical protein